MNRHDTYWKNAELPAVGESMQGYILAQRLQPTAVLALDSLQTGQASGTLQFTVRGGPLRGLRRRTGQTKQRARPALCGQG